MSSYPVWWTRFAVLRDFLQNFFDASGPATFAEQVAIVRDDGGSLIEMGGPGFALEWLLHMGASTKTSSPSGAMAGYFGEGFKIAALCALRDHRWQVSMGSRGWSARVVFADERIDGVSVRLLAYDVASENTRPEHTWLLIGGTSSDDHEMLAEDVRQSFSFVGNPLFGPQICDSPRAAVWERSSVPVPRNVPYRLRPHETGLLFMAHQARATLPIPFVIALPHARDRDRDRSALYDFQVNHALTSAAGQMSPEAAVRILQALRAHWQEAEPREYRVGRWANVVSALVRRIRDSPDAVGRFRAANPGLVTVGPVPRGAKRERNLRSAALAWARSKRSDLTLVQPEFDRLGYPSLEQACTAADGYPRSVALTPEFARRISLLEEFVAAELTSLFAGLCAPTVAVMDETKAGWGGWAALAAEPTRCWSATGRRVRFRVLCVVLSESDLKDDAPGRALATYVHERCHAFGGDASAGFSAALTDALGLLAAAHDRLAPLSAKWRAEPSGPPRRCE